MGRAFDLEFADALGQFAGAVYPPVARMSQGPDSSTFLAFAPDGRPVAVRFYGYGFARDTSVRIRMANTAELIDALDSPRFARHIEVGSGRGRLWVASDYVPGPSLQEAVDRYGPLSREGVRHLAQGLIEAFAELHEAGLAGRGLEADEVVLGRSGPVLVDPGFTRVEGGSGDPGEAGGSGALSGASEASRPGGSGEAEPDSSSLAVAEDVRAIGAVLYFAATGRPASSASSDILSPAVGNCPSALREAIEASQRGHLARPSLQELARAAGASAVSAGLAAQWLEEPWQSADVLREINERAGDVARLHSLYIDRTIIAAAAPPMRRGRDPKIRWEAPKPSGGGAGARRRLFAGTAVRGLLRRFGSRDRDLDLDRQIYR